MQHNPLLPGHTVSPQQPDDAAVNLVREKVARAYGYEPSAVTEMAAASTPRALSKHQHFMAELSASGKSLAEIQTAWHAYYLGLSDPEKQEVWQEFYAVNKHTPYQKLFQQQEPVASRQRLAEAQKPVATPIYQPMPSATGGVWVSDHEASVPPPPKAPTAISRRIATNDNVQRLSRKTRKAAQRIQSRAGANGSLSFKHHIQSLLFGLSMGFLALVILLFSFFNEYIIAPFIQPSRKVSGIPIIVSNMTPEQAALPTVIVPKINIQIPVDYKLQSIDETDVQQSLENGVLHYPSTVLPGQNGNAAFFGHSSMNILNSGKYKFAFVRLHEITTGDIFYVTYNGKVYAYQVFAREIVPPSQVSVLADTKGKQATAVLITCDPPGFSTNRLVVWGEQISPSIATNTAPTATVNTAAVPTQITSNGPTLWTRMWRALTGGSN